MKRLGALFVAAAMAVVPACKDNDARDKADEAAENVAEAREEVRDEVKDVQEAVKDHQEDIRDQANADTKTGRAFNERQAGNNAEEIREQAADVREEVGALKTAQRDFAVARENRVTHLRMVHGVIASQPVLINALMGVTALTDKARAELAEKMQVFQMRVDETGNAIEALQSVDEKDFEDRSDTAAKALERLDDAREDAWEALNDGDRIEAS